MVAASGCCELRGVAADGCVALEVDHCTPDNERRLAGERRRRRFVLLRRSCRVVSVKVTPPGDAPSTDVPRGWTRKPCRVQAVRDCLCAAAATTRSRRSGPPQTARTSGVGDASRRAQACANPSACAQWTEANRRRGGGVRMKRADQTCVFRAAARRSRSYSSRVRAGCGPFPISTHAKELWLTLPSTAGLLHSLGWDDGWEAAFEVHRAAGLAAARVAVQHRGAYDLIGEPGEVRASAVVRLAREGGLPAVGDWVALRSRGRA